jgi:hypothetical protein
MGTNDEAAGSWPPLPLEAWRDTRDTLHMWTQVVGKVRLALAPPENHWWHVPLYLTARGLSTSPMPVGGRALQIDFDFLDDKLLLRLSDGPHQEVALRPRSVADFYQAVMAALHALEVPVRIWPVPVEVADPIPFERDTRHAAYDAQQVRRFWRVMLSSQAVLQRFRSRFLGKSSPVHFFWGSFDLASTRFSGRPAPEHPTTPGVPDRITREAYSHEVWSAGFWPGDERFTQPIFYAYAYPAPPKFDEGPVMPAAAHFDRTLGEFVLPYEAIRTDARPDEAVTAFLQSTYEAAASRGGWDRAALERPAATP